MDMLESVDAALPLRTWIIDTMMYRIYSTTILAMRLHMYTTKISTIYMA